MKQLEQKQETQIKQNLFEDINQNQGTENYQKIKSLLESFDINQMTPLQALQLLAKLKDEIKE
ncbi:MAG: hypothetical protein GXP45_00545 [bacterium]|nr:hypothetical protein [bacterium]